jgi:hypothetical protein
MTKMPPSFYPDAGQELLLKAALLDRDEAVPAWAAWQARLPVDDIDAGSQRLLPLLASRLRSFGVDHPDLRRYDSVARYFWVDNQFRLRTAKGVISLFAENGITAMPLKGLALAPLYYGGFALRPMSDFDLLVPTEAAGRAARLLIDRGWRSTFQDYLETPAYWSTRSSAPFHHPDLGEFDLHWHILFQDTRPEADDVYWRHARPMVVDGLPATTLSDTDHLFHACIHGACPNPVPPIRWVADAAKIIAIGQIDWDRMLGQAEAVGLVSPLLHTLPYLRRAFGLPIPDSVIAKLASIRVRRLDATWGRLQDMELPGAVWSGVRRYLHYRRNFAGRPWDEGFRRYLLTAFGQRGMLATIRWSFGRFARGWPAGIARGIRFKGE